MVEINELAEHGKKRGFNESRILIEIIKLIRENPTKVINAQHIANELHINWRTAKEHIRIIEKFKFLKNGVCDECLSEN